MNENSDDDTINRFLRMMKSILILNAVEQGWKVKKIGQNSFEFKKNRSQIQDMLTDADLFSFLANFNNHQINYY